MPGIKKIWEKAKKSVKENEKLKTIGDQAREKLTEISKSSEDRGDFARKVSTLIRMLRSHINGEYRAFSGQTLLMIAFALLYFIIPTDLIPDFLPVLGLSDDIALVYYIIRNISVDLESFEEWEAQSGEQSNNV